MPLLLLKRWRESAIGLLVILLAFFVTQWKRSDTELKQARLVYENPQVKTVEKVVYRQGPVRIKTIIVKEKDGNETTTVEEVRDPATTETIASAESTPIPLSITLAPARTDRYLLTFGVNRLSSDFDGKAILVGYGFKNRLDLQAGIVHRDETSPWIFATLRF